MATPNTITVESLTASIKLSNNGYLFAPSVVELIFARAHPAIFTTTAGCIKLNGARRLGA